MARLGAAAQVGQAKISGMSGGQITGWAEGRREVWPKQCRLPEYLVRYLRQALSVGFRY